MTHTAGGRPLGGIRRLASTERGAAALEFAVVLPLLVLLVFGIVQFGFAFWRLQAVQAAAREGARIASLSQTTVQQIEVRVEDALTGVTLDGPVVVSVDPGVCQNRSGEAVRVIVETGMTVEIPLAGSWPVDLTGEGEFRCE